MLRALTTQEVFNALLDRSSERIRLAFVQAIEDIQSEAQIGLFARMYSQGNIVGALRALNVEEAVFSNLAEQIRTVFIVAADTASMSIPAAQDAQGFSRVARFNAQDVQAVNFVQDQQRKLISIIMQSQEIGLFDAITRRLSMGVDSNTAALDVVGRLNRADNKRAGGLLGLNAMQMEAVDHAYIELLSDDLVTRQNYLNRYKRLELVDSKIAEGPLDKPTAKIASVYYAASLFNYRAATIGVNEANTLVNEAYQQAYNQAIQKGVLDEEDVQQTWRSMGDGKVRHTHQTMHGQTVPLNGYFTSPAGARLRYPHDPDAPLDETQGCRCQRIIKVDDGR